MPVTLATLEAGAGLVLVMGWGGGAASWVSGYPVWVWSSRPYLGRGEGKEGRKEETGREGGRREIGYP